MDVDGVEDNGTARDVFVDAGVEGTVRFGGLGEFFVPCDPDACPALVTLLGLALAFVVKSGAIFRNPVWTKKSQTRLVLLTSILTRSRASRRRSLPPLLAYSLTSVSLITR